jgi:hypothetical protein
MYSVDIYNRVRRACLKDGMSARAAALYFNKDRKTIAKMLRHELPPGYPGIPPCNQDCLAVLAWEILVNPMLEF